MEKTTCMKDLRSWVRRRKLFVSSLLFQTKSLLEEEIMILPIFDAYATDKSRIFLESSPIKIEKKYYFKE